MDELLEKAKDSNVLCRNISSHSYDGCGTFGMWQPLGNKWIYLTLPLEEDHLNAPLVVLFDWGSALLSRGGSLWFGTQLTWRFALKQLNRRRFMWCHWSALSSGGLELIGWLGIKVLPDGVVMYGCSHSYKQMPNSMSEWDDAVTLEKDYPQTVAGAAKQQLAQAWLLRLGRSRSFKDITTKKK